jgi:hypothetical protein
MTKTRVTSYEVLIYIAYGFFILLGLTWFTMSLMGGSGFNATAFFIVAAFGVQTYYRHRLTNLILGVLALFFSIFMLMDVLSTFNLLDAKHAVFDGFTKALMAMSVFSIGMSIVLVFGYVKMSFKDQ